MSVKDSLYFRNIFNQLSMAQWKIKFAITTGFLNTEINIIIIYYNILKQQICFTNQTSNSVYK